MGSWGALIMGFFGSVFAALTAHLQWGVSGVALSIAFLPAAAIGVAAAWVIKAPGEGIVVSRRAERAIMWSSIGEGIGIFLAVNIVANLHRPEWLLPAIALVVGFHFLPIARAARFRPFYALSGALLLAAIAGITAPPPLGGTVAGSGAAGVLWAAAVLAILRERRAKSC